MSAMFSGSPESEAKRKADALVAALVGMGTPAAVEPRGTLVVLRVSADVMTRLAEPSVRREMIALAKEQGFTHVAVELG
jgi:hypothetical protein